MDNVTRLFGLYPNDYRPHALHAPERPFRESNCYVDLWVGLLHGLSVPPEACLAFTLGTRLEGDQWTFYKPPLGDLRELTGVRVEEVSLWRSVLDHCESAVALRRVPLLEADSFYLPDTKGTDYRREHVKTTIGIVFLDRAKRCVRYFHNAGFYEATGDDFDGIFRLDRPTPHDYLPPYCEVAVLDGLVPREPDELRSLALTQARWHFARRGEDNPLAQYAACVDEQLQTAIDAGNDTYHRYVFSSLRQIGSAYDFCAYFLRWLAPCDAAFEGAAEPLVDISDRAKMLIMKTARMAHRGRVQSVRDHLSDMARSYDDVIARLTPLLA